MTLFRAAILIPDNQLIDSSMSFIGGSPNSGNIAWPVHPTRPEEPLHLIAQLGCEDIHRAVPANPLPKHGVLQFFLDTETFVNVENKLPCRVVWQAEVNPDETLKTPKRLQSIGGQMWSYLFGSETLKMMAPCQLKKTSFELHSIETTIDQAMLDVGAQKGAQWENYRPNYIGPWNFWHQSLGKLPDLGGGPKSQFPEVADCILLLRLVCDKELGLDWDEEHNPSLSYWIKKVDLEAAQWDQAFARFTDF